MLETSVSSLEYTCFIVNTFEAILEQMCKTNLKVREVTQDLWKTFGLHIWNNYHFIAVPVLGQPWVASWFTIGIALVPNLAHWDSKGISSLVQRFCSVGVIHIHDNYCLLLHNPLLPKMILKIITRVVRDLTCALKKEK